MHRLAIVVEGVTEQRFVTNLLKPRLLARDIDVWAQRPGKGRGNSGGWESVKRDIVHLLHAGAYCTTMFDFYALPTRWPGRVAAGGKQWRDRAAHVESHIAAEVANDIGASHDPSRFIPYVQLHEFEATLFADPAGVAGYAAPLLGQRAAAVQAELERVLSGCGGHPEAINDGYDTCPSRRLTQALPGYRKALHSPGALAAIGLEVALERCSHFREWIARLDALGRV